MSAIDVSSPRTKYLLIFVCRLWNLYKNQRTVSRKSSIGYSWTATVQGRFLSLHVRRHSSFCTYHLALLWSLHRKKVPRQTVYKLLLAGQLYRRQIVIYIPMTPSHRRKRFNWKQGLLKLTPQECSHNCVLHGWVTVSFIDCFLTFIDMQNL